MKKLTDYFTRNEPKQPQLSASTPPDPFSSHASTSQVAEPESLKQGRKRQRTTNTDFENKSSRTSDLRSVRINRVASDKPEASLSSGAEHDSCLRGRSNGNELVKTISSFHSHLTAKDHTPQRCESASIDPVKLDNNPFRFGNDSHVHIENSCGIEPAEHELGHDLDELGHDPDEPGHDPVELGPDPDELGQDPDEPGHDPVELGPDPDELGQDPDEPGHDPVELGPDPDELGQEPDEFGHDPDELSENLVGVADKADGANGVQAAEHKLGKNPVIQKDHLGASMAINKNPAETGETSTIESEPQTTTKGTPNASSKKKYGRNVVPDWFRKYKWMQPSKKLDHVYCSVCIKDISYSGGQPDLNKHQQSKAHTTNSMRIASDEPTLDRFVKATEQQKDAELKLCAWAVEHGKSAKDVEDFAIMAKELFPDSKIAKNMQLGRTKASAIVSNVLGRTHHAELVSRMKVVPFSLLIDESTDIANKKTLVLVVRLHYWKNNTLEIHDAFYAVIELVEANATTIYNRIVQQFFDDGIPYKSNLIGFAADGCNTMFGDKMSVAVLLKKDCPKLVTIKCICHSFALCSSYACKELPPYIEQLCRDIYSFLKNSPLRNAKFNELQQILDLQPLKMLHPSATRWLSLESVVNRLLERYSVLKTYFNYADDNVDAKQAEKMREISKHLENPITEVYLNILSCILPKINQLNKLFQSESPKVYLLKSETERLAKTIMLLFMRKDYIARLQSVSDVDVRDENCWPLEKVYIGIKAQQLIDEGLAAGKLTEVDLLQLRQNVQAFYKTLVTQIKKRIRFPDTILTSIQTIDPHRIKDQEDQTLYSLLRDLGHLVPEEEVQQLDDEFRELINTSWGDKTDWDNSELFWGKVLSSKRMDGDYAYPKLRQLIPVLLSLPHSSAAVERIFSLYNANKTKTRNRLLTETMGGILSAREYVRSHKISSGLVEVTSEARQRFNSDMYK